MKNLLHNIQILAMLVLASSALASCSEGMIDMDTAEVGFTAMLPSERMTKSFGEAEQVNTLIVGIYDSRMNEIGRKSFGVSGTSVNIRMSLAQNQTYNFIFWAYDGTASFYDLSDLRAISMKTLPENMTLQLSESADAFFATVKNLHVDGNSTYPVEMFRPLAQINVGTTETAVKASFTARSVSDTFHPFTNTVSGTRDLTWKFNGTTSDTFSVEGTSYNYLAMGYLFAPTPSVMIEAELTLTDGEKSKTIQFPQVEIEANHKSNIGGDFKAAE